VLAHRARLEIAYENLAIAERLFGIVEARYRNGAVSALDVSRQRTTVLAQRDAIVPMQAQERQTLRALAILAGRVPQYFEISGPGFEDLAIPQLDAPLPGELLARRPDLAAVEARLAAADADIAVARAALFPLRLSLGLSAGLSGTEFGLIGLGSPLGVAAITLSLVQAVFDGGRLRGQVEASESQRRQVLESYRGAVLTALKEVEDALAAVERSRLQEQAQLEIRTETERALRLSELRYREGSDGLGTLLDAQRSLFLAQDQLVQQRLARLAATVDLYKALGGGWSVGS
jgi:outer membrane protein, multidrug efflux system